MFFLQVVTYIMYPIPLTVLTQIYDYLYRKVFCIENKEIMPSCISIVNKFIGIDVLQSKKQMQSLSYRLNMIYFIGN